MHFVHFWIAITQLLSKRGCSSTHITSNGWECLCPWITPSNRWQANGGKAKSHNCFRLHITDYQWIWTLYCLLALEFLSLVSCLFKYFVHFQKLSCLFLVLKNSLESTNVNWSPINYIWSEILFLIDFDYSSLPPKHLIFICLICLSFTFQSLGFKSWLEIPLTLDYTNAKYLLLCFDLYINPSSI